MKLKETPDLFENAIAKRIFRLHSESAFKILARAKALEAQGKSIIHLEIGQPDFKTPQHIINAACKAIDDGYTGYSPSSGFPEVREAIADYAEKYKGIRTNKEEIVVVPGGKPVMFYTMLMLVDPGDEVLYPNPGFPIYESCINFAGGIPVAVPLTDRKDFKIDIEGFRKSITEKTKLVILNSPSNPTGSVLEREDILAIAEALKNRPDIFILSDEVYDRLIYEGSSVSIASLPGFKDRTIVLDSLSKSYSMTGWRLGYGIMHPDLARYMDLLLVNSNSCSASFTQIAAMEALKGPQDTVEEMKGAFRIRRDYLVEALNAIPGIRCRMPKGAFYTFPDISSFGLKSEEFANRLLEEGGVAAAGGLSFGSYGEGHLRLSYANSLENIKIAAQRIERFTKTL